MNMFLHFGGLGLVLAVEELGQAAALVDVDGVVVEPGGVAGYDDVVGLLRHVLLLVLLLLPVGARVRQLALTLQLQSLNIS